MAKGWAEKYPGTTYWGDRLRTELPSTCRTWPSGGILKGDYRSLPDIEATWFVDPPYQG